MAECETCSGASCRDRAEDVGLTADDCCTQRINSFGVLCDDSETAPCIIGSGECFRSCDVNRSGSHLEEHFTFLTNAKRTFDILCRWGQPGTGVINSRPACYGDWRKTL